MTDRSSSDPIVAALLREREGYQRRGMDDRVAAVDAQLKERGYEEAAPAEDEAPKGRQAPPRRTTKGS